MSAVRPAVGVDVGGTKIAAGLVDADGAIVQSASAPTPSRVELIPPLIADLVGQVGGGPGVPVGIGAAGFVASDRSTVRFAPNIAWRDEPFGEQVARLLDTTVVVENDANAAAWGEFAFGAGEDVADLLLVTIGTGIGGGIVHNGALMRGASGVAAEIGHMRVVPDGIRCGCGQRGCFEQYGSGRALVRMAQEQVATNDPRADGLRSIAADADGLTGPEITALAEDGDELARELLAELGRWVGEGVASLVAVLDPGAVVIGGGVVEAGDLLMKSVGTSFAEHLTAASHREPIALRPASLGNRAGLIGAADLARIEA